MPHTSATHLTITPKHVYINGEPANVDRDRVKLSDPNSGGMQTVTLTIAPTSVTILNDDDPSLANAAHEAVARHTRDETGNANQNVYQVNWTREACDAWKRYESKHARREWSTRQ